ncbi:MAG: c-type cytochrome [Cyclobacteriaceae bacterium]
MNKPAFFLLSVICFACGGGKAGGNTDEAPAASAELIKKGEQLVNASDCKTCHHQVNKIIGPSHLDVAKKYEFTSANVTLLANRIIQGGSGVWGDVPMTPHPDLSVTDAENMARYVLSLDGEAEKQ